MAKAAAALKTLKAFTYSEDSGASEGDPPHNEGREVEDDQESEGEVASPAEESEDSEEEVVSPAAKAKFVEGVKFFIRIRSIQTEARRSLTCL